MIIDHHQHPHSPISVCLAAKIGPAGSPTCVGTDWGHLQTDHTFMLTYTVLLKWNFMHLLTIAQESDSYICSLRARAIVHIIPR
jgi:hypothetical protein